MSRQSRPGILSIEKQACMLGSRVSDPSFVTRDMSRIRHSDTQSLSRDHRPRTRFRLSPMSRRHNSGPGNDIYQSWDWGSGNALQIEGTMPGLARHHYTIINLMSLCEEIWIIEMASHLSLLTAPRCVLRVPPPRIPEWRWWHLINIIKCQALHDGRRCPLITAPHSSLWHGQAANFVKTVTTRSVNSIKLTGLWVIFVFYLAAALLYNNLSYQDQYPSERRWTFKQIKLVRKIEIQIDGFNLYLTGWQVPLLL